MEPEFRPPPLVSAALWYATQGHPVFPCEVGGKRPLTRHGFKDATTSIDAIRRWWDLMPEANIGLPTGIRFDVVDIDGQLGQETRAKHWCDGRPGCEKKCRHGLFGQMDAAAIGKVSTPRDGGMHIYLPPTAEGNAASALPGIDYRGVGGYVIAPPSVTPIGRYSWLGTPSL